MRRLRDLAPELLLHAAIVCAVLAPLALPWLSGRTLAWFDTQKLYAPQRWLVEEALRAFQLPLWNPHMGAGMPFFAEAIHGVLHPVSILAAWLRSPGGVDLLIGGHVAFAAVGAALLARTLGASRAGSTVAAFAYAMSGFVLSMAGNLVFLAGAGSLPLCVAGLRRFAVEPAPRSLLLGVGGTALLVFTGDYQAVMIGGALALALSWEGGGARAAGRAVAAGTVGLLVAAVQIAPTVAYFPLTQRAAEDWSLGPSVWAFEPWRLPELVLPGLLRNPDPYVDRVFQALASAGGRPVAEYPMPFAASVFVGLLPLALSLAAVRDGRRGRLLGVAALILLWAALGPTLGASSLLGHVPLWRSFRYSEKLVGPLTLAVSLLAGLGSDALTQRRVSGRWALASAAALGVAAFAVFHLEASALPSEIAALAGSRALHGALQAGLGLVALAGWVLLRARLGPVKGGPAMALLVWLGMGAAAPAALHPGDPESRLGAPGPGLTASPPGARIVTPYYHDLASTEPEVDMSDRAARQHAALGYPAQNVQYRLDSLNEYSAMTPERLGLFGADRWNHFPLAPRRYGVTHLLLDPTVSPSEQAVRERFTEGGTRVGEGPAAVETWTVPHRDWASFAPAVRPIPDEQAAIVATTGAIVSADPTVVVESFGDLGHGSGRVLSVRRQPESLRIEAEADEDATLVVNDAWWPGWEATLDGLRVTVFRADAFVRAVRWPAGRHVLEMRYRPPELRLGLVLSALGVVVASLGAVLLRRRRAVPALGDPP